MTYQLFIGLDVGKGEHHATALLPDGTIVHDKSLAQSEPKLRQLFTDLVAQHGTGLVVVDQPKTIGALPVRLPKTSAWTSLTYPA